MDDDSVRSVTEAVENVSKYCTAAVEQAVKNFTSRFEIAAGAFERDFQNLVLSIRERVNDESEGERKSTIVASCKRVPSGGWFLLLLGMAGILIARGEKKRCGRTPHPSICHCVQLQPPAFHFDQPLKTRRFCAQDIFYVEATIRSFGSPHWEKTHEAATKIAVVLETFALARQCRFGHQFWGEGLAVILVHRRWFARNAGLLMLVGRQLCTPDSEADNSGPKRFYMARDLLNLSSLPQQLQIFCLNQFNEPWDLITSCLGLSLHDIVLDYFKHNIPAIQTFKEELDRMNIVSPKYTAPDVLRDSMLVFHRHEFKSNHGEWVVEVELQLTCTVETRVQRALFTPSSEALMFIAGKVREELRTVMDTLLQAVIPVGTYGCPMSVSLLARKGADLLLLETVFLLHTTVQHEVLLTANPGLPTTAFINQIR